MGTNRNLYTFQKDSARVYDGVWGVRLQCHDLSIHLHPHWHPGLSCSDLWQVSYRGAPVVYHQCHADHLITNQRVG